MKELDRLTTRSKSGTCLPTSSSCVRYEGPDIPCITVCQGESIEQVLYDLATIVCTTQSSLDISSLAFGCLVSVGSNNPATLKELLQLLITKSCTVVDPGGGSGGGTNTPSIINLPSCLYHTNAGETITSMAIDAYVEYLAGQVCDVKDDIIDLGTTITNLQTQITNITSGTGGSGAAPALTITSGCLSATSPGQIIPITTAFENLESTLCSDYLTPLGKPIKLQNFISYATCPTASTLLPCGASGATYGSLANWVANPTTAFELMQNMALAICKLDECAKYSPSNICVALPPTNIVITDLSNAGCKINWTNPLTLPNPDLENPVEIRFQFFDPANPTVPITLQAGGGAIGGQTFISFSPSTSTNVNLTNGAFVAGLEYIIRGFATYTNCGTSGSYSETKAKVKETTAQALLHFKTKTIAQTPKTCVDSNGTSNNYIEKKESIKIELKNPAGNYVNNGNAEKIKISFEIYYTNPCITNTIILPSIPPATVVVPIVQVETINIVINSNASIGEAFYISEEIVTCVVGGLNICKSATRVLKCLKSITLLDSVTLAETPLPASIIKHSSISNVPVCP
jgi:hypothetical protein